MAEKGQGKKKPKIIYMWKQGSNRNKNETDEQLFECSITKRQPQPA